MTWGEWPENNNTVTDSTRRQTRPNRPIYAPPPTRPGAFSSTIVSNTTSSDSFSAESTNTPGFRPQISNPTRSGRSRGRGHDTAPTCNGTPSFDPTINRELKPFDVSDEFDELEIAENAVTGKGVINFDAYEDIPVEASGVDIPSPVNAFADLDLGHVLNMNIQRCKYVRPTPIQRHAIPIVLAGRDLMACAQTGSGKTAAFCFPIISGILNNRAAVSRRDGKSIASASPAALILSPTRELACQIYEEGKKFAFQTGVKIVVAYGGTPISQQFRELNNGVDILVATPGRLVDIVERGRISLGMIKYLALDEADRMLDMGFEPQIRKIVEEFDMPHSGVRQTMLFSATFPDEIQRLASDFLSNYIFLSVGRVGSSTYLIEQKVELVQEVGKRDQLMHILYYAQKAKGAHGKLGLTLIFVETKRGADALEHWLSANGFPATAIHGDKVQMEREKALRSFKNGSRPIMVATDVAARGLDIPCVAHVINFDFPRNIDDYVHRIGRTGRAGNPGLATAFFTDSNMPIAKALFELMTESNQEVPSWLSDFASTKCFVKGDRGQSRSKKFGGYDFRKDGEFRNRNYNNYSRNYGNLESYHDYSSNYGNLELYDNSSNFGNAESCNNSSNWWNVDSGLEPYSSANDPGDESCDVKADSSTLPSNANYHPNGLKDHQFGCDSIVATGWD